jgi:hypothetical protein
LEKKVETIQTSIDYASYQDGSREALECGNIKQNEYVAETNQLNKTVAPMLSELRVLKTSGAYWSRV